MPAGGLPVFAQGVKVACEMPRTQVAFGSELAAEACALASYNESGLAGYGNEVDTAIIGSVTASKSKDSLVCMPDRGGLARRRTHLQTSEALPQPAKRETSSEALPAQESGVLVLAFSLATLCN